MRHWIVCALDPNTKLEQIYWEQQALQIEQGKGHKDRRVYLSPDAIASLRQCLEQHPGERAHGYVFWNRKRLARPLSVKASQKKLERYANASSQKMKQEYMRTMQKILKQGQV
jgi:site-specific recombinase XerD